MKKRHNKIVIFGIVLVAILVILSIFLSSKGIDFGSESNIDLIIFYIVLVLTIIFFAWVKRKLDLYFTNKKLKVIEYFFG